MDGLTQLEAAYEALREGLDRLRADLAEKESDRRDLKASLEQQVMDMAQEAEAERQKWRRKVIPLYLGDDDPAA